MPILNSDLQEFRLRESSNAVNYQLYAYVRNDSWNYHNLLLKRNLLATKTYSVRRYVIKHSKVQQ